MRAREFISEHWTSGPENPPKRRRDPDAWKQEKIDAEADAEYATLPKVTTYQVMGRGPNMEPNYEFGKEFASHEEATAYRRKLMADPKTPHPEHIGIRSISRVAPKLETKFAEAMADCELDEKTSPKLCRSTKRLGRSDHSSCVSQGLRPHGSAGKGHTDGHGHYLKGKKAKGTKYGGDVPDYSGK